jgi:DNA helicase-2/ATP-dependent DNA helicase PcrA
MPMPAAYLDNLNTAQRGAVEHGVFDQVGPFWSLLAQGPGRRILWRMTFSRRAAAEMAKRVERISRKAMGRIVRADWAEPGLHHPRS